MKAMIATFALLVALSAFGQTPFADLKIEKGTVSADFSKADIEENFAYVGKMLSWRYRPVGDFVLEISTDPETWSSDGILFYVKGSDAVSIMLPGGRVERKDGVLTITFQKAKGLSDRKKMTRKYAGALRIGMASFSGGKFWDNGIKMKLVGSWKKTYWNLRKQKAAKLLPHGKFRSVK